MRGVSFEEISGAEAASIYAEIQADDNNMDVVRLDKAPKIAVYVPPNFLPWDDAVTLAMEYAEIPYAKIWDDEVLRDSLTHYDWLHLHHEDFTGQYGKFYANFATAPRGLQHLQHIQGDFDAAEADLDGQVLGLVAIVGREALRAGRHGVGGLVDRLPVDFAGSGFGLGYAGLCERV